MRSVIEGKSRWSAWKSLPAIVALALSGCAGVQTHTGEEVIPVRWVTHESQASLNDACGYNPTRIQSMASMRAVRTTARFAKVNGCFKQPVPGGVCTIHTLKMPAGNHVTPAMSDFFETLGHESAHCFVGRFHN